MPKIVYEINFWNFVKSSDPRLKKLFSAAKLVKNADIDK